MKARILFVEDDQNVGAVTKRRLEEHGYEVRHCTDGLMAWEEFQHRTFDICLLDVMIPKKGGVPEKDHGFELARQIRKRNDVIPILFITSKSMVEDKIAGFKTGADDYITKPINLQELFLRIEVFLKRTKNMVQASQAAKPSRYVIGRLTFDYNDLRLHDNVEQKSITLTQKEADLLRYLCENANKALKREDILFNVWGKDDYFLGRSMDVFITKLRKYFKSDPDIKLETLHGVGFRFNVPHAPNVSTSLP
ncbi:response regulator transcription factor [Chitinophaga japonensis]|uniref:DNA-binding response OmpR family regulator n=1 Tax=Chitinophaga japonensis TaxID=104662 RepID=A0A562TGB0_CHIJA|nr:response regulator transcription factor [Chitinophaga japonensis]TWI92274.1 DNA-binding response OmpR family regulator [Chitinophaga japonensis]